MKIYFSVEIKENDYNDDTFCGTYTECVEYLRDHNYTQEEARIAKFLDDGDPTVTEIIDDWEE